MHWSARFFYACKECPENDDNVTVVEAPRPKQVIAGGFASPEAIAHIMTQKFVMGSPLYRQEQEHGLELSRQTMANWLLQSADMWLRPVYDLMHKKLLGHDVLHADETTLQVLHEDGRKPQSKSYIWVYRTSGCAEHPIVLYKYEHTRSGSCAREFLKGFKVYLHTDDYHAVYSRRVATCSSRREIYSNSSGILTLLYSYCRKMRPSIARQITERNNFLI